MNQIPSSMEEFNTQASRFIQKAKESGKSNAAIANTLKFMYQMTLSNIEKTQGSEKRSTQVIDDAYGNKMLIDTQTGEVIKSFGDQGSDSDLANLELSAPSISDSGDLEAINNAPSVTEKTLDEIYTEIGAEPKKETIPLNDIKNDVGSQFLVGPGTSAFRTDQKNIPLNYPQQEGLNVGIPNSPFKGIF